MNRRRPSPLSARAASRLAAERIQLVASLERMLLDRRRATDSARAARWPDAARLRAWQETAAAELTALLGWPLAGGAPARTKAQWRHLGRDRLGEIRTVRFGVTGRYTAFALLFTPKSGQPAPLVIAQHGGLGLVETIAGLGRPTTNYHGLVTRLRQRGCAVLVPQLPMWNQSAEPHCPLEGLAARLNLLGGSAPALQTLTLRRALDAALALPGLCDAPVGLAGLSYGGCYGLYAAALDPRIRALLTSGFFNDRHAYPLPPAVAAGAALTGLDAELGALVCPRALWIEVADRDELFSPAGARTEAARLRRLYRAAGHASRFRFSVFAGTHEFNRSDAGLDFLVSALR
jgi:dienelactone hydrolase